jgi:hypothetical protein
MFCRELTPTRPRKGNAGLSHRCKLYIHATYSTWAVDVSVVTSVLPQVPQRPAAPSTTPHSRQHTDPRCLVKRGGAPGHTGSPRGVLGGVE